MNKPIRRLGRGLDGLVSSFRNDLASAVIGTECKPLESPVPKPVEEDESRIVNHDALVLPILSIEPNPLQPRGTFDENGIRSLARSIQRSGLLQPVTVRPKGSKFEIIAGERRWRAAQQLGWKSIPVHVRDATEEQMLEFALMENLQREDLNPIDRAAAYQQFRTRFALKPEEIAARVGEDRTTILNYLRLLDLPEPIRALVAGGKLSMGHARCLVGIEDPIRQKRLAELVVKNDLSVRTLEERIRNDKAGSRGSMVSSEIKGTPHIRDLQRRFEDALKTRVTIVEGRKKGSGRLIIEYYSLTDFDRIGSKLGICLDS